MLDREVLFELTLEEPEAPELEIEAEEPLAAEPGSALRILETGDYNALKNRPSVQGVTLEGDRSFRELGLEDITEAEIDEIVFG